MLYYILHYIYIYIYICVCVHTLQVNWHKYGKLYSKNCDVPIFSYILPIAMLLYMWKTNGWKKRTPFNNIPTVIQQPLPPVPSVSATSQNWWRPPSVAPRPFPAECAPRSASPPRHSDGWAPGRAPHAHLHPQGLKKIKGLKWWKSVKTLGVHLIEAKHGFRYIYHDLPSNLLGDSMDGLNRNCERKPFNIVGLVFFASKPILKQSPFTSPKAVGWLRGIPHVAWSIILIHPVWSYIPTKPPFQAQIDHQISLVNLPGECWWSFMGISPSSTPYFLMPKSPFFIASSRLNHG